MSRVYFHSPSGEAELRGSERAYAASICGEMGLWALKHEIDPFRGDSPLLAWVPPGCYLRLMKKEAFARAFQDWFMAGLSGAYLANPETGDQYPTFRLALNTAVAAGSDPVRLLARIHGSCEIHCYVEGPDRAWLAAIMEVGLRDNVFRTDQGWESVIEFLGGRDDEPVVMSYSVTEGFPDAHVCVDAGLATLPDGPSEERDEWFETWGEQSSEDQWTQALEALRLLNETWVLRLDPATFAEHRFWGGESAFDIARWINDARKVTP